MKILFIAPRILGTKNPTRTLATFHEADVRILRGLGHQVDILPWQGRPWASLLRRAMRADAIYVWTIGDHTGLAIAAGKFLRKPVLIVIGGYEFANLPLLDYGNLSNPRGQILSRIAWNSRARLLFVDPSLEREAEEAFGPRPRADEWWPLEDSGNNRDCDWVPTGYDANYWRPDGEKKDLVLTVAHAPSMGRVRLKGVDRFLEAARHFPQVEFHVVGELPSDIRSLPGALCANVILHGWMERDAIRRLYQRAKVYCQLSLHEGLPNGLCEACLCECVPVGTMVNGIPAAMGGAGFGVGENSIVAGIQAALTHPQEGQAARQHIAKTFPIERRERALRDILECSV